MIYVKRLRIAIVIQMIAVIICMTGIVASSKERGKVVQSSNTNTESTSKEQEQAEKKYIKWVDFNVSYEALSLAYDWDIKTITQKPHIDWISLLAYSAAKTGGEFNKKSLKEIEEIAQKISSKEVTMEDAVKDLKYYTYYQEVYEAVLSGLVGNYKIQTKDEHGETIWKEAYGLIGFSPIAKGFDYNDYDDFGTSRSYGYSRPHLGHDMMGQTGTPIIAVESGTVEAIGWNQYGGWRLGIRSFDKKRYYYYAHLRQNYPYQSALEEGSVVTAGDVIGYMGHTGYSTKENVNNIKVTHLHFGIQLIFDESQKDSDHEIWIDCYSLIRFLRQNQSEAIKKEGTKEWQRSYEMKIE